MTLSLDFVVLLRGLVLVVVAWIMVDAVRDTVLGRTWGGKVFKGLGLRHFAIALPTLVVVIIVAYNLVQVPFLDVGWWSLLGGEGSIVLGDGGSESFLQHAFKLLMVLGLAVVVPGFAYIEERIFRRGAEHWSWLKRAWKCGWFGAVHLIMGIPIGVASALSIGGAVFMWAYLRELDIATREIPSFEGFEFRVAPRPIQERCLLEAARVHAAYNYILVDIILIGFLLGVA